MVKFTNDFGEWTCLGESSLKFLNEHFHDDFFQDTSTGKNPLNICHRLFLPLLRSRV